MLNQTGFQRSPKDNSFLSLINVIVFAICGVIIALIILIINLIIKTVMVRRNHEFGIQKAIGYTSLQIRNQLAIELMSVSLVGVIIGVTIGILASNKFVALIFSSYGIKQADFLLPISVGITAVVGLSGLIYLVTFIASKDVKTISAYGLLGD